MTAVQLSMMACRRSRSSRHSRARVGEIGIWPTKMLLSVVMERFLFRTEEHHGAGTSRYYSWFFIKKKCNPACVSRPEDGMFARYPEWEYTLAAIQLVAFMLAMGAKLIPSQFAH